MHRSIGSVLFELGVILSLAASMIVGTRAFWISASERLDRLDNKPVANDPVANKSVANEPVVSAPPVGEGASLFASIAVGTLALLLAALVVTGMVVAFCNWRLAVSTKRSEKLSAACKAAKDEKRAKQAKIAGRRASCEALAAKTPNMDLQAALKAFIEANRRWADGRASGSYGDNPRLRHAIEVVESACLRVLSDTSLMSSEDAHLRLVEPLQRATGQLNAEMTEAVTAKLADMSLDLDLAQRAFETAQW